MAQVVAVIGVVAAVAGTAVQVHAAGKQAAAEEEAARANAAAAENAAIMTEKQGAEDERQSRIISKKQLGEMKANYAASGLELSGSPLDWLAESHAAAENDALNIRHNAAYRASTYRQTKNAQLAQAEFASSNGALKQAGYGLSGISTTAGKLGMMSKSGGDGT